jgi:catechol 2,3-dioxygenase-like lactoylglutathione lyase family enzyme
VKDHSKLSINANNLFLYYQDLENAQEFYEGILGLRRVYDFGFASLHQVSPTTYISLVDESRGMHKAKEPKSVTLSFITQEVDDWFKYIAKQGVPFHRILADATRHPTRGFVALDPEGYFLEFETFLQHPQNISLNEKLSASQSVYPRSAQATARPANLGVQGNICWLYYEDLPVAQVFYEDTMGLPLLVDQGFARVYGSSKTGFIGLVDGAQGLHKYSREKSVTVSFFSDDLKAWWKHLKGKGIRFHSPSISVESGAVENFVVYDPGDYYLEFDRFLDTERYQV